jgi:hypothetical protein
MPVWLRMPYDGEEQRLRFYGLREAVNARYPKVCVQQGTIKVQARRFGRLLIFRFDEQWNGAS